MKRSLRRGCNVQGLRHAEQAEALNEAQPPERLQLKSVDESVIVVRPQ